VSTSYFAEGFPYSIVNNLAEILFKEMGASLRVVGLTALFHLPWNLKFLWGPFVDQVETKRRWMIGIELGLAAVVVALSWWVSAGQLLGVVAVCFGLLAVLSATHDIAIDGFYLEGLDERGQARFVGYRAMAYRIAGLLVRGPLVMLVGVVGWTWGLAGAAAVLLGLGGLHALVLPRVERRGKPLSALLRPLLQARVLVAGCLLAALVVLERRLGILRWLVSSWFSERDAAPGLRMATVVGLLGMGLLVVLLAALALRRRLRRRAKASKGGYAAAFDDFLAQPAVGRILVFVVLFRCGESFLGKMKWPFLRDEIGLSLQQYGFASGTLGVVASLGGTFLGGWLISRHGLRRWIWPFVVAQNALNLLYMALAEAGRAGDVGTAVVTGVVTVEHFGEGLGTAVFMVYLMRCCHRAHKAAHMAILTALMSVSFTVAGVASGFLAEAMGFSVYFGVTFLATIPGMLLIPFLPHVDERQPLPTPASAAKA